MRHVREACEACSIRLFEQGVHVMKLMTLIQRKMYTSGTKHAQNMHTLQSLQGNHRIIRLTTLM